MSGEGFGEMTYWNSHVYFAANNSLLLDYSLTNGQLTTHSSSSNTFEMRATPSVSAKGNKDAILWALSTKVWNGPVNTPAALYAFDAVKLGAPIYTSEQNS